MRLAIPIFRTRISPVFDFSTKVLIIYIEQGNETGRHEINLYGLPPPARVELRSLQIFLQTGGSEKREGVRGMVGGTILKRPYLGTS